MTDQVVKVELNITTRISIGTIRGSPVFTFYVCHNESGIPLKYGFPTGSGSLQAVPDADKAVGLTFFRTYIIGSSNPHCPISMVYISDGQVPFGRSVPGLFEDVYEDPDINYAFRIEPVNKYAHTVYSFKIQMITRGGKKLNDTAPYTLVVGCVKGYTDPSPDQQFIENAEYLPKEFRSYKIYFPNPGKFWWCTPIQVEPIEIVTFDLSE